MTKTPKKATKSVPKLGYMNAAALTVSLGVTKRTEFTQLSAFNKRPPELPFQPDKYYQEYTSWKQFIADGTEQLNTHGLKSLSNKPPSYKELKCMVHDIGIKSKNEFYRALKKNKKLNMVPSNVEVHYGSEFDGWEKLLKPKTELLPYDEALVVVHEFAIKYDITSSYKWAKACKEDLKPKGIPVWPNKAYKSDWCSWKTFLGVPATRN
ncbi:MAG: hypothetical protein ACI9T7_000032 [Oleiphilaceae bacterium]|jgi:hypothetical protein